MSFFLSGTFWFIEGILVCAMVIGFKVWMDDRRVTMTWWKWGLFAIWAFMAGLTLAYVGTNVGENEPNAAIKGGLLLGFLTIVVGVVCWRLIHSERRLTAKLMPFWRHRKSPDEQRSPRLGTSSST